MQSTQTEEKKGSLSALDNEEKVMPDQVKVLVGGFPLGSKISEIRKFLCKRFPVRRINIATDKKNKFYGFVFIKFDKREQAEQFTKEDLYFEGVQLDVKLAVNNFQFIEECIQNMRTPNKVFIDNIPRNYTKKDVFNIFSTYGKVADVICVSKKERSSTFAYVTFEDSQTAKECVNSVVKGICEKIQLRVEYGNPKFSTKMLNKIHPTLQNYISEIQENIKNFNPKDFDQLCKELIETGQSFLIETNEEINQSQKKDQKKIKTLQKIPWYGQNTSSYGMAYDGNDTSFMGQDFYGSYGNVSNNFSYNYNQNDYNIQNNTAQFNDANNYLNQGQLQSHPEQNYNLQQQYYNENQSQDPNNQQFIEPNNTLESNCFNTYDQSLGYCNYEYDKNCQVNENIENTGYYTSFNNVDPNVQSQFNNNGLVSGQNQAQYSVNPQFSYDYYGSQNYNNLNCEQNSNNFDPPTGNNFNSEQNSNSGYDNYIHQYNGSESNTNYSYPNSYNQNVDLNNINQTNQYTGSAYDNQNLLNEQGFYIHQESNPLPNQDSNTDQIKDELVKEQY